MTVESAIHIRGKKIPDVLWEQRKAQLMEIYQENERLLKEMEADEHGVTATGTY